VGVSNQQPDLTIVISVGIFDNFQRMSMGNHREVREVIIFEEGEGGATFTFNGICKTSGQRVDGQNNGQGGKRVCYRRRWCIWDRKRWCIGNVLLCHATALCLVWNT
jgi:hypothetical protein